MNPDEGLNIIKEQFKTQIFTGIDNKPWENFDVLVENMRISAKFLNANGIVSHENLQKRSKL